MGAFVAILGLTATAEGQISRRFTTLLATSLSLEEVVDAQELGGTHFPADADERVNALSGVRAAGVWWPLAGHRIVSRSLDQAGEEDVAVLAASSGALQAMRPIVRVGATYAELHESRGERVAVVGAAVAKRLGVLRVESQPAVFIRDVPFTVIGVIENVGRIPEALSAVIIPRRSAEKFFGPPDAQPARMVIETTTGAAAQVGRQSPLALRPDAPEVFRAVAPPDPRTLRRDVTADVRALFLFLAVICLVIGALGIANTTLVAVLERRREIGLRRALGARPLHIAVQFLVETAALGTLGGLAGSIMGVGAVIGVSLAKQWTALLQPVIALAAPGVGTLAGLLSGLYPAIRAARVEPVAALRE